jgi:tetratricopeptide (TPR) repeat protein
VAQDQEEVVAEIPAFDLELQPVTLSSSRATENQGLSGDALIAELVADMELATEHLGAPQEMAQATNHVAQRPSSQASPPAVHSTSSQGGPAAASSGGDVSLEGPLGDLFEEFRAELGEINKEDEDLETHYNLGIAYREMGLLDEAISEFQKVAKAADKGAAFRYAMQCSTLLGLAFMEKEQPAIAAIWYERALKTPGLDQESILALRYDLGVAQEMAGEKAAAYNSFSQVYAMNIDYRDVSERIALLGKAR